MVLIVLVLFPLAVAVVCIMAWGACKQLVMVGGKVVRLLLKDEQA